MGFSATLVNWIKEFIQCPTFSVMVKGSPSGYFESSKGTSQGDL